MEAPRSLATLAVATAALLAPPAAQAAPPSAHPLAVRVLASGGWKALPVSGARLRVVRGGRIVARGRSGSRGMALLAVRGSRRGLRVVASGGRISGHRFGGAMAAEVRRYRWPATVHVDSVTTLATRFHRAHPRLTVAQANGRTKRFLTLPRSYVVGRDGRSNAAFDGRRFLAAAGTGRRYDRFVTRLAARVANPKAHRSFAHLAHRRHRHGAGASVAGASPGELEQVTEAISEGSGFFDMLEKTNEVLDFADAVMQISGVGDNAATPAEVRQLSEQLQQVEQSIGVVQTAVEELRDQGLHSQYSQLANEVEEAQSAVESAEETIHSATELALQEGCVPRPRSQTEACEEVGEMITGPGGLSRNLTNAQLVAPSEVNAFAERIAGSALPGSPPEAQGLIQDGSALTSYRPKQVFYTRSDSEELQSIAAYWISYYTEALAVVAANWEVEGAPADTLASDVEQVSKKAVVFPSLIPATVPQGTVVDMAHGWMWPTQATGQGTYTPYSSLVAANPWRLTPATGTWTSVSNPEATLGIWMPEGAPTIPFENWLVAGTAQINPLLEAVTPGPGQLPGEAVVEQAGMNQESITPWYPGDGHGLEMEYLGAFSGVDSGCRDATATSCYWPVLAADEVIAADFHTVAPTYYYVQGTFEVEDIFNLKWEGLKLWGFNNHHTIFGSAAIEAIPVMFFRPITSSECYFYPAPGSFGGGSPGCP
jgi:hypothetical protein